MINIREGQPVLLMAMVNGVLSTVDSGKVIRLGGWKPDEATTMAMVKLDKGGLVAVERKHLYPNSMQA